MAMRRRDFLGATAMAGVGVAGGGVALAADKIAVPVVPKRKAVLKLSCQEWVMPGANLTEKLDNMEKWGYQGLELGGKGLGDRVESYKKALADRPIKISAICAGYEGVLISEKQEVRRQAMRSMKEILTAAGELGSTGLIIVPAFNKQTKLHHKESREILIPLLKELGEHAVKVGSRILLEPLNRKECYFLRLLADAAAICRDADSSGIRMMGDFWHMTWEETSDLGAFISAGDYLHHVHVASRKRRKAPGEDEGDNYVAGLKGLKWIGYQDYVSLECGVAGDKNKAIPAAARLLREQWAQA